MDIESVSLSCEGCSAACLDRLDLGRGERLAVEACRKLVAVKVDTLRRDDRTERRSGGSANASIGLDGLAEGPELLSVVAVGTEGSMRRAAGEGGRERVSRRGGMGLGGVVDRGCHETMSVSKSAGRFGLGGRTRNGPLPNELYGRSAFGMLSSLAKNPGGKHGYVEVQFGLRTGFVYRWPVAAGCRVRCRYSPPR